MAGLKVVWRCRAVPAHVHTQLRHAFEQGRQQFAVVELAFTGQIQSLVEALLHAGLQRLQALHIQPLGGGQFGALVLGAQQEAFKAFGFGRVLSVPQDQGAVLLKEHGLGQGSDQLRPTRQAMVAHANDRQFGDGRLCQRRQHGSCHASCRALAVFALCLVHLHAMARLGQGVGQHPTHQASAQNHTEKGLAHVKVSSWDRR